MANLIETSNFKNYYSNNLLSKKSLFNDNPTISYSGDGSVTIVDSNALANGSQSAYLFTTYDIGFGINDVFSFGDALEYLVTKDAVHIFQFSVLDKTSYGSSLVHTLKLNVYIDSVLTNEFTCDYDINEKSNDVFYNFSQSFEVSAGQVVNFEFGIEAPFPGVPAPTLKLYFSGFKLEVDDKNLFIPTSYTLPLDTILETTQTLDFPSIIDGGSETLTIALAGASELDFVYLSTNLVASNSGLTFFAYVSATDVVEIKAVNNSGSTIDLASGLFKIKIVK
jgi:hypothetical protein